MSSLPGVCVIFVIGVLTDTEGVPLCESHLSRAGDSVPGAVCS